MQDPFAAAPVSDEAQALPDITEPLTALVSNLTTAPVVNVSAPSEGKVTVTLKGGVGYDAPWIVIHAADAAEASSQLDSKMIDLMDRVQRAGKHFAGLYSPNVMAPAAAQAAPANPSAPPAGATQPPNGETRSCKHGQMQYRSGFSEKTNKTWQAFMCPTPKGAPDQCAAEWIR